MEHFKILDIVALLVDRPESKLVSGQVGTILEQLDENVYEVEFADKKGRTLVTLPIESKDLMLLHFENVEQ